MEGDNEYILTAEALHKSYGHGRGRVEAPFGGRRGDRPERVERDAVGHNGELLARDVRVQLGVAARRFRDAGLYVHHAPGQAHIHRPGLADQARQPLRTTDTGHGTNGDFGLAKFGIVSSDDEIAGHC